MAANDPVFTPEQITADGRNRVTNTGGQVGIAVPVVGLGQALCQSRGWLHGELDPVVFGYWVAIVTVILAGLTNIGRLRGQA